VPTPVGAAASGALGARNLVLVGFMGTGKSTLGRAVATAMARPFRDTDALVEARAGCPVAEIFRRWGEERFRRWEAEVVATLAAPARLVIATGGGAFGQAENRAALLAGGLVVALTARPEVILERVGGLAAAQSRPLLAGGDPLARIRELLAVRAAVYAQAHAQLDVSELTPDQAVAALLRLAAGLGSGREGLPAR
jgi:shikimate kinase